ncbi:XcbB/CpsF family capsular polysaccharide biosynthesis protein [Microbulbifer variabilis]|uniref:XcbB/CpsF family capsular polysaccharide biosynthesis protein n=1 Tax=Microbulbifer variabilis TaxID=266805 RepID=A0ABY4V6J9_9GAMM|nr:XcbB/CpsF family capsular polysaccharide biosynthesis protein [Microbulbifer variabilis]USD19897.1 XcbB/CpsF family capsular polysaccharide biosynthesis protein [Microbulbifer variabilis]
MFNLKIFKSSTGKLKLNDSIIEGPIEVDLLGLSSIDIDRSEAGHKSERLHNIYGLARRNKNVKNLVVKLTNSGFYLTHSEGGVSTFSKFKDASSFSKFIKKENLQFYRSIFYTLEEPQIKCNQSKLLIIFSSVADRAYNSDIATRNFYLNYKSIQKYIPNNTYVLRLADIGGVVGSFYLNNNFNNQVENDIQLLISEISANFNIHKNDIVLYGASKGGTGSLYHAILGQFKCVSVDPIITGEYHFNQHEDSHFVSGTFPEGKAEKFSSLLENNQLNKNINIIYSELSPIFSEVESIFCDYKSMANFFNYSHPKIKSHADVSKYSMNLLMLLINNLFYEVGVVSSKKIEH